MKLINKKNNQITFSVEIEESLANAIRRYLNQIPISAIDEVEISRNDSALYDETIAHRIGLVPLSMDKSIKDGTKLKIETKEGTVYSKELKGTARPVYENIPLTILDKGQELKAVATIKTGTGSEHSKFSPGLLFYRNTVDIKIDKDCPKEVVNVCPKKILKLENDKVVAKEILKCDMCEACTDFCKKKGKDSITLTPKNELIITIESFGQLDVKDVFKKSIEQLKKDLVVVSKKIAK